MKHLDHPVFGLLEWRRSSTTCDWRGTILLPSLAERYERWCDDCTEFHRDRRSDAHCRGEFSLLVSTGSLPTRFCIDEPEVLIEPSPAHVEAHRLLTERHAALADILAEQFAAFVRKRGRSWFMGNDEHFERLLQRDMILGTLELQGVVLWSRGCDGVAYAGLAFHSEIWEPEHGVGAVALGDRILRIGCAEDSWQSSCPPNDDGEPLWER